MEEEANDGGAHALLPGDRGLHHRLDGAVQAGAGGGVEAGGELRRRGAGQHKRRAMQLAAAADARAAMVIF